jgi:hypothetical protein
MDWFVGERALACSGRWGVEGERALACSGRWGVEGERALACLGRWGVEGERALACSGRWGVEGERGRTLGIILGGRDVGGGGHSGIILERRGLLGWGRERLPVREGGALRGRVFPPVSNRRGKKVDRVVGKYIKR